MNFVHLIRRGSFQFLFVCWLGAQVAQAEPLVHPPVMEEAQKEMWERREAIIDSSPQKYASLNGPQRQRLLELVLTNRVARFSALALYDPPQNDQPQGEIGYCYGRAMAAHLLARKVGVSPEGLKKVFAAGDMQNGTIRWRFHMATLVLGEDENWYAIDPIVPSLIPSWNQEKGTELDPHVPLELKQWIDVISWKYDNTPSILQKYPDLSMNEKFTGTIKFYVASTEAMMVDMREVPSDLSLENGERINEILFSPLEKKGFEPVFGPQSSGPPQKPLYYLVEDERTLQDYFMVRNEPPQDQFNFFQISVQILYLSQGEENQLTRFYLYNGKPLGESGFQSYTLGYFPSLLSSIEEYEAPVDF